MKVKIFILFFLLTVVFSILSFITVNFNYFRLNYSNFLFLRTFLLSFSFFLFLKVFHLIIIKSKFLGEIYKNLLASFFSFSLLLIILEIIFTFVPRSHGVGFAYAGKNWKWYYFEENKNGFRDNYFSNKNKKSLYCLGDSFTAGAGIADEKDRFSNILANKYPNCFSVKNIGKSGTNTITHFETLKTQEKTPEILIYQYFGNDIIDDARKVGKVLPPIRGYQDLNKFQKNLAKSSYLLNFLYWFFPKNYLDEYFNYLKEAYRDKEIVNAHLQSLSKFLNYCKNKNTKVLFLIIPYLNDIHLSEKLYLTTIKNHLKSLGIPEAKIIDLSSYIKKIPIHERVVNSNDPHANENIHRIIADLIITRMEELQWVKC